MKIGSTKWLWPRLWFTSIAQPIWSMVRMQHPKALCWRSAGIHRRHCEASVFCWLHHLLNTGMLTRNGQTIPVAELDMISSRQSLVIVLWRSSWTMYCHWASDSRDMHEVSNPQLQTALFAAIIQLSHTLWALPLFRNNELTFKPARQLLNSCHFLFKSLRIEGKLEKGRDVLRQACVE